MKVILPADISAQIFPLLKTPDGIFRDRVVLGQLFPGDFTAPESVELRYCTISKATAARIKKLIQAERDKANRAT